MATNRIENAEAAKEEAKPGENGAGEGAAKTASSGKGGGLMAWLPLILSVLLMPALAYAMTTFVLLPKVEKAMKGETGAVAEADGEETHAPAAAKHGAESKDTAGKPKQTVPLTKVLVNVSGSMGTRYLLASLTLVGTDGSFKDKIEKNRDQLMDVAAGALGSKTIADLEKPGARNLIRTELTSVFNHALGEDLVKEIYITEFAIQ